jgi:hypothetical protein
MNQETVQQLKNYYETRLIDELSTLLNYDKTCFSALWQLDKTEVHIVVQNKEVLSTFHLTYDNTLTIAMKGQRILLAGQTIVGLEVLNSSIDLNTFNQINNIFATVLNESLPETEAQESIEND